MGGKDEGGRMWVKGRGRQAAGTFRGKVIPDMGSIRSFCW